MNTRKTTLAIAVFIALSASAYAQNASDFTTDGKGTITGYNGKEKNIVIPSKIGSETITTVGVNAFYEKGLTSVTIPNSIKVIDDYAFRYNSLTSITIGANIELVRPPSAECSWSFDNNFDWVYNNGGKKAGTYTRPNTDSETWTRK